MARRKKPETILWLVCLLTTTGCDGANAPVAIVFVIPDDFRGVFVVQSDPKSLNEPPTSNEWKISVSDEGVVGVTSVSAFQQWHREAAMTKSGTPIPRGDRDGPVSNPDNPGAVFYWCFGTRDDGGIWYYVGTVKGYSDTKGSWPFTTPGRKE